MNRFRLLAIFYVILGGANIARGIAAFAIWPVLAIESLSVPLLWLGVIYLLCGGGFFLSALAISLKPTECTRKYARGVGIGYQGIIWLVHFLGDRASYARSLWLRDSTLTLIFLTIVILWTLPQTHKLPKVATSGK